MKELIELLEKAEKPDRDLDAEIMYAVRNVPAHQRHPLDNPPYFTSSINHALALVPEGSNLEHLGQFMCLSSSGEPLWQARVRLRTLKSPFEKDKRGNRLFISGFTRTPAIALCIAALKARSPT